MRLCKNVCARKRIVQTSRYLHALVWIGLSLVPPNYLRAQALATAVQNQLTAEQGTTPANLSPLDHSVYAPVASAPLGTADAVALTELKASSAALIGSSGWIGVQASGTMTYSGDATQYSVTLTNLGSNEFRLDTQTPSGVESVRISGRLGKTQAGTGPLTAIDPDTAIMGIFPFELIAKAAAPGKSIALADHGLTSTAGQPLHRVTLELTSISRDPAAKSQKALPIDLYFDPSTHLLVKSVNSVLIPGARLVPFLSVVSYSDYRQVGGSMIPFHFTETLNGQPYRTVQLDSAQTNPTLPPGFFQFERSNQ